MSTTIEQLIQRTNRPAPAGDDPGLPTPEAVAARVEDWAARLAAVQEVTTPGEGLDAYFAARRQAREAKHRIEGLMVAPESVFDQLEHKDRVEFDAALKAEAAAVARDAEALAAVLDRLAEAAHELKPPRPATVEGRATVRVAELLEREEVRRQFSGRPVREVLRAYRAASDADDAAFVAFLESEALNGFRTLPVSNDDADAVRDFVAAIRERQAARVPARVRELKARLDAAFGQTTRLLLKRLASGKATIAADGFRPARERREAARD